MVVKIAGAHEYIPLFELRLPDPAAHPAFQLSAVRTAGGRLVPPGGIHSANARRLAWPARATRNAARHAAATVLAAAAAPRGYPTPTARYAAGNAPASDAPTARHDAAWNAPTTRYTTRDAPSGSRRMARPAASATVASQSLGTTAVPASGCPAADAAATGRWRLDRSARHASATRHAPARRMARSTAGAATADQSLGTTAVPASGCPAADAATTGRWRLARPAWYASAARHAATAWCAAAGHAAGVVALVWWNAATAGRTLVRTAGGGTTGDGAARQPPGTGISRRNTAALSAAAFPRDATITADSAAPPGATAAARLGTAAAAARTSAAVQAAGISSGPAWCARDNAGPYSFPTTSRRRESSGATSANAAGIAAHRP